MEFVHEKFVPLDEALLGYLIEDHSIGMLRVVKLEALMAVSSYALAFAANNIFNEPVERTVLNWHNLKCT